jgi:hypothetical protein
MAQSMEVYSWEKPSKNGFFSGQHFEKNGGYLMVEVWNTFIN